MALHLRTHAASARPCKREVRAAKGDAGTERGTVEGQTAHGLTLEGSWMDNSPCVRGILPITIAAWSISIGVLEGAVACSNASNVWHCSADQPPHDVSCNDASGPSSRLLQRRQPPHAQHANDFVLPLENSSAARNKRRIVWRLQEWPEYWTVIPEGPPAAPRLPMRRQWKNVSWSNTNGAWGWNALTSLACGRERQPITTTEPRHSLLQFALGNETSTSCALQKFWHGLHHLGSPTEHLAQNNCVKGHERVPTRRVDVNFLMNHGPQRSQVLLCPLRDLTTPHARKTSHSPCQTPPNRLQFLVLQNPFQSCWEPSETSESSVSIAITANLPCLMTALLHNNRHSLSLLKLSTNTCCFSFAHLSFRRSLQHTRLSAHDPYLPCDVSRQSDRSTKIPTLTGHEPKLLETQTIEPEDLEPKNIELETDPYQIQERSMRSKFPNPITEDVDEFEKVGAEMSLIQSQMHSDCIVDSDFEDGELRNLLTSPLFLHSRKS